MRAIAASVACYAPAQPEEWPDPKPITAELKPVPAFDADTLLPDVLRAWVTDEAERMPCPPDFIAVAALVALGATIGARCAIKPKAHDNWLIVPNLWGGIFGGIQPDKLLGYLEQASHALANDGMLQRFQLLVYPDARRWEWRDRIPDKAARDAAFNVFEKLADFDPVAWGAAPADDFCKFPHFRFDEDAQAVLIEWMHDLECTRIPNEDTPIIRQHLSKFNKLFPALALIFHLADCVTAGICGAVSKEAALRAAAWCEYLEAHARRCYGLLKDDGLRAAQALAIKLENGALQDGFTLRDVRRNQWRGLTTDEAIQAALDWLEDQDWLRSETVGGTGPGSGRRTQRYTINPALKGKNPKAAA